MGNLPAGVELRSGNVEMQVPEDAKAEAPASLRATMVPQIGVSALPPLSSPLQLVRDVLLWTHSLPIDHAETAARRLLERVGLGEESGVLWKKPHQLSGGMAARACLAAAMATSPAVLVLDEPSSSLDLLTRKAISLLLLAMNRDHGVGLVVLTHDMWLAAQVCSEVVVLDRGKVVESGAPRDLALSDPESYVGKLFKPIRSWTTESRLSYDDSPSP